MRQTSQLLLLLFLACILLLPIQAPAADKLQKGQNLTDSGGDTLVSAGGSFTLGFFSPGVSTKRYVGIWFSVSNDTVYWVANRDQPLVDKSGMLVFNDAATLVLLDGARRTVWSSDFAGGTSASAAQLLDSGNLVVRNGSSVAYLWQSFDYPSDTLLPSMKLGKNLWTGTEWQLTSWRSADDPSPGEYRRTLETKGLPELVLWRGNVKTHRSGPYNGLYFNGVPEASTYMNMYPLHVTGLTARPTEITYGYTAVPGAPLTRVVVNHTGVAERLVWNADTGAWISFFSRGARDVTCDAYGKCGAFGLCDPEAALSGFCGCLPGFRPASTSAWQMKQYVGGCQRDAVLECRAGKTTDRFKVVSGVKLPDTQNATVDIDVATLEECEARCYANCSCLAYSAADIRGGGNRSGCVLWTDAIVDLRLIDSKQDLYLRLSKSEFGGPSVSVFPTWIIIGVSVALIIILVLLAFWFSTSIGQLILWLLEGHAVCLCIIRKATGNFSEENIIGRGGFSDVYMGRLFGREFAVKRLIRVRLTDKGKQDFKREVKMMSTLTHVNLAKLLYHCREGNEWILVYEYMENKSLNRYIFAEQNEDRSSLNWAQRLEIIHGIAVGVEYLHGMGFVHRDLKPGNILLSDTWKSKIADFTTAKLFIEEETDPTVVLTPGYVAPEYLSEGTLTIKCDVYSFGVVLLEIVTGTKRTGMPTLLVHAWELWNRRDIEGLLDQAVGEPGELLSALARCIHIALLCVQNPHQSPEEDRPSMSQVVAMLTSTNSQLRMPSKPTANRGAGPSVQLISDDTPGPSTISRSASPAANAVYDS
ncbi:S-locus-specific glycoprotein S6-like isoform X1 [Hordeum vulgare subsp. vulgare]|uniref:Receptor-like serine/threonine-protein kinase n=1 Tax=Hordeum vulgare subsp. vulgare TaxID=112509 RepID=A0A8I6WX15_HORVV|nr:S-locus-specific glycoprotein S6-like isoform X1 [Hordeum vulgare subsp. vulgare]